jgi:hypothetical protein
LDAHPHHPRVLGGSALRRSDHCGDFPDHHREVGARQRPAQGRARGRDADRKETREDKLRDEESLYSAAQEFAQVATEILTETIDAKGVFKILPDRYNNRAGRDDPKAMARSSTARR